MVAKGQRINDRYEIVRNIGEGGMANVYLAHDTILNRDVAVKILRGDLANDEKFVRRFQREAISASSLSHPNIVEMYDVGEDGGNYFIVMEYVNGKTLKSLIRKRGALTLSEVIDIMLQLTSGIAHAHDSYIIHRDIKPQNVLILDDGMVKITDFGIAMALNSHELTQTNSVMGSVHYLPPEQASGSGSTIKSDIYSLGILMFELLTGKLPFKGENPVEIAIKQMKDQIPSICKMNSDIPQSVENIILRACAKNPQNRYDSIREMHDEIKNCLNVEVKNVRRINYKYPEQELEKTKKLPNLSKIKNEKKEEEEKRPMHNDKKINRVLIAAVLIFLFMAIAIASIVIIYPMVARVKEVKIPDVANLTAVLAEEKLEKLGLKVSNEDQLKPSDAVIEGSVISTLPAVGRSIKKGQIVTLVVSIGTDKITLEDYTGKNYYEIKTTLESHGITVLEERKEVEEIGDLKEYTILEQNPKMDTVVEAGDTVTFFLPDLVTEYPDFVNDDYTLELIQAFATKYKLILNISYVERDDLEAGTILSQTRTPGTNVEANATLRVGVSVLPSTDVTPGELITE